MCIDVSSALLERFVRYAALDTASSPQAADRGVMPSTPGQRVLADMLRDELRALGAEDAHVTDDCYVCARLPASPGKEGAPVICFSAHLDTSDAAPGAGVAPAVERPYRGERIALAGGAALDPALDAALARAAGETIIHSAGDTLLGADDKAGVAEIVTALAVLASPGAPPHGAVEVLFSPDEETGHGMDRVPLEWLRAKAAYTFDGDTAPLIEAECFNAYKSVVTFGGVARHTGAARPGMVNAVSMAADFIALLPRNEAPETTDGRQGFYAPLRVSGKIEAAEAEVLVRDFDEEAMRERLAAVDALAEAVRRKYRGGAVRTAHTRQYGNMKAGIAGNPRVMELLVRAVRNAGAEPEFKVIRGGTDGSRLTELGIPAPNIFTGGHNFHSRTEWASLEQMALAVKTAVELAALWGQQ